MHWIPRGASTLLDAGCSAGYATAHFAKLVDRAAGIDVDEDATLEAQAKYPEIDFQTAPLERIPHADESFDVVVCLDVLEHVSDEGTAVEELFRVLRPRGTLILTTPHRGAFGFLDPINLPKNVAPLLARYAPGLERWMVAHSAETHDGQAWWQAESFHRHYTEADVQRLLDTSVWQGNYEVVRRFRGGLLIYPIATWLGGMTANAGTRRIVEAVEEADYLTPWGPLSYNLALKIRKLGHARRSQPHLPRSR
jgi:SAM-dependent methyltransferase